MKGRGVARKERKKATPRPLSHVRRGVLTGKYKRDERPTEGRIAWASEDSSRSCEVYPSWDVLHGQQRLWDTLHTMERVARHHGTDLVCWW